MLKQPTAATGTGVAAPQSTAAASAAAASSGGAGSGGAGDPQQQTIAPEALLAELGSSRRTTLKRKGVAKVAAGGGTASKAAVQQAVYEVSEKDYLEFTPLGSGNEVGRSCHILKFKGKTIMVSSRHTRHPTTCVILAILILSCLASYRIVSYRIVSVGLWYSPRVYRYRRFTVFR